jgi:hypothetical protein
LVDANDRQSSAKMRRTALPLMERAEQARIVETVTTSLGQEFKSRLQPAIHLTEKIRVL